MAKKNTGADVVAEKEKPSPMPVKKEDVWTRIFRTVVETPEGEHTLVELQQNANTKDIRAMRV